MQSEDNCLESTKYSKSKLTNDLITYDNLSSSKSIETNIIQRDLFYLGGNFTERELENNYNIKKELESENEKKLNHKFNQDIIHSMNEINFKSKIV